MTGHTHQVPAVSLQGRQYLVSLILEQREHSVLVRELPMVSLSAQRIR
jgi:hypothetical protein